MKVCDVCGKPVEKAYVLIERRWPSAIGADVIMKDSTRFLELCEACRIGFMNFVKKIQDPTVPSAQIGFDRTKPKEVTDDGNPMSSLPQNN